MPRMTPEEVDQYLQLPHVAVLSASREGRGPIASPIWYDYVDGDVRIVTARDSVHGRAIQRTGWATLTVRSEEYGDDHTVERYANVEGPISFADEDITPVVTAMRRRYYTGTRADEWIARPLITTQEVAVLRPERVAGFYWEESL